MSSSGDVSPSVTPSGTPLSGTHAPKFGTVIPNRIFVGGIAANTTEVELKQFFTSYGAVKDSKIIADRAGVSKGYGFITFENQEDAERIIKKEADNLVFKDRKLNIGPAVRKQQVLPRTFDTAESDQTLPTGAVMFSNGVPYTFQNGMAVFHAPEGGYPIPQTQPTAAAYSTVMVPQTPTMYVAPQYSAYQQTTPQWATSPGQWRWTPQSPGQTVAGSPSYIYAAMHASPDLMYAQPPPHAYQPTELTDTAAAVVEAGQAAFEGSMVPISSEQTVVNHRTTYVTEPATRSTIDQQPISMTAAPMTTVAMTMPLHPATPSVVALPPPSKCSVSTSVAPYTKKTIQAIPRRPFSSPTILVKHGHKVQRVMVPTKAYTAGTHVALVRSPDTGSGDASEGVPPQHAFLTPPPTPDIK